MWIRKNRNWRRQQILPDLQVVGKIEKGREAKSGEESKRRQVEMYGYMSQGGRYCEEEDVCPACLGRKVQKRGDGINITCPACLGSGKKRPLTQKRWNLGGHK